jgi:lipopolysaccharide/colanic/teichoic acid biosynthesis glycosyltransferase
MLYKDFFKPLADTIASIIFLLILSPVFVIVFIALSLANKGKPFFYQYRPGKDEKIFKVIKFKTMNDRKDENGNLLPDKDRITAVGKFVRKTSLDEIPQLLNVIKGDMSIIGPRPLLVKYLPLYSDIQKRRHEVRPGITGWAQVNGRNAISWEEKFKYDVYYVDHIGLHLDIKIFFKTLEKVLKSEGISAEGQATTKSFKGNNL